MDTDGVEERLVVEARRRLAEGVAPGQVFARLAENETDVREAALAVCLAIGVPRAEADERIGGCPPADWILDGDEDTSSLGAVHEAMGTFDPHVELSSEQRQIAAFLGGAVTEIGWIASGSALRYGRNVRGGRLREAFVMLSRPDRMGREVDTTTYWARLVEAAEMLGGDGDAAYVDAVQRCRDRLAQSR